MKQSRHRKHFVPQLGAKKTLKINMKTEFCLLEAEKRGEGNRKSSDNGYKIQVKSNK